MFSRASFWVAGLFLLAISHLPLAAQTTAAATLTSPAPSSTLSGSTATFKWTAGTGVTAYWLSLGTNGPKSANVWESGSITATSVTATGLPTTGATLNVTVFSMINGAWVPESYVVTEATQYPALLTSPKAGSKFTSTSVAFSWTTSSDATAYFLSVGSVDPGSANLWESGSTTATSATAIGLPITGITVYVTLFSKINGVWIPEYYTFTAASPTPAAILTPTAGSVLGGATQKFTWNTGLGTTAYFLSLGTTAPGSANLWESGSITTTSATAAEIPVTGGNVYVTLFSMINSKWVGQYYTYTASGGVTQYQVNLAWDAPVNSPETISGYNVYRAPSGSSIYQQINPSVTASTAFTDTNVVSGDAYDYYVESVDTAGVSSVPSTTLPISIP